MTSGLSLNKTVPPQVHNIRSEVGEIQNCNKTIEPFHYDTWGATGGKEMT